MKRRDFLGATLAGTTGLLTAGKAPAPAAQPEDPSNPFKRVPLGRSGLMVSKIGIGTGMKGYQRRSNQTRLGDEKFHALLRYAYERGVRYFDMADLYGTHSDILEALKGVDREEVVLVTKLWWREGGLPEKERLGADVLVERYLSEMKTDYVDLVHLHAVTDPDWPQKLGWQMDLLSKLKDQGKIRAHGVSVHAIPALETAAEHAWVDAVHTRINPYGVCMDGPPEQVVPVLEKMHKNGKGVTGMKIIGEGQFRNDPEKRDQSIRYFMGLDCVDACIVGFEKPEEVDDFRDRARAALSAKVTP
jgi:aryl-alcohol dehydrogenase-like predicted oxidoreductase